MLSNETYSERINLLSANETDAATEGVVTLHSLITLRWITSLTQIIMISYAYYLLKVSLPLGACLVAAFAGMVLNFAAVLHRQRRPRLYSHEAAIYLAFDILQLSLLIFLTGGLDNPFCLFMVMPVAIAASMLRFWAVAGLTVLTIGCILLNATWHLPLPWPGGALNLPPLFGWVGALAMVAAVAFLATFSWNVARVGRRMRRALNMAQQELASAQQMTAMGALAAAVAHELGTPLGTISLVAKELLRETPKDSSQREDIELLVSQADRCRQVLADFARKPAAEGGDPYRIIPLDALIEDASLPHRLSGVAFVLTGDKGQLMVRRRPELVHGLGNFIQNAFQYARGEVRITLTAGPEKVIVIIEDNGPGYASGLLQKLGEPYISTRENAGAGHMGLGIFIAKTLLERIGARVVFANRREGGARVTVTWLRNAAIFAARNDGKGE